MDNGKEIMNELVVIKKTVIGNGEVNSVDARELHKFLESGQQFSNWIKNRIKQYDFTESIDFITINNSIYSPPRIDYAITLDMAKELSMVENNEKGKQARKYFIACEKKLKEVQYEQKPMSQLQMISHIALELDSTNKVVAEHSTKLLEIEASQKDIKEHFAKKAELQKLLPGVNPKSLRAKINQIVRSYSTKNSREYWETWGELYKEFYYRNSINVKLRAKRKSVSPLDYLEKNELLEDTMALAVELFS